MRTLHIGAQTGTLLPRRLCPVGGDAVLLEAILGAPCYQRRRGHRKNPFQIHRDYSSGVVAGLDIPAGRGCKSEPLVPGYRIQPEFVNNERSRPMPDQQVFFQFIHMLNVL